jgi:PKD repeat protein
VWVLGKKPNGDPDPNLIQPFVQDAETPVDLVTGPGGDLYYVDYGLDDAGVPTENAAGVHRIVYTGSNAAPTARIVANPTSGLAPLTVGFDATTSTDPDGDTLTYAWDLDADGQYDDSTSATPQRTYTAGTYDVGLRVNDGHGHTSTATQQIQSGNSAPTLGTVTPDNALTWSVGQTVSFSATATDTQQGTLPDSAFSWNLAIRHCPGAVCHTHNLSTFPGVKAGSFQAPDHEYPSHLLLTVTVKDAGGLTDSRTVQLDPKTVALSFASSPSGATVTVNATDHVTPYTETFIQGSRVTITAAPTTGSGATAATFASWSDGGARSHELSAPTTSSTYTASYTPASPSPASTASLTIRTKSKLLKVTVAGQTRKDGWSGQFAVGSTVRVVARKHQVRKGVRYEFVRWSDRGARKHTVQLWEPAVTLTAIYRRLGR